jgi:hypothetical protein
MWRVRQLKAVMSIHDFSGKRGKLSSLEIGQFLPRRGGTLSHRQPKAVCIGRMARISVNAAGDLGMVPINYVAIDVGEKLNSLDGKVLELEEEVDDQFEFDRHTENRFSQGEERIAALEADKHRLEGLVMELMAFARSLQAAPTD